MKLIFVFAELNCSQLSIDSADYNSTEILYQTHVNVSCHPGFQLDTGQNWAVVQCQANRAWSPLLTACTRMSIKKQNIYHSSIYIHRRRLCDHILASYGPI